MLSSLPLQQASNGFIELLALIVLTILAMLTMLAMLAMLAHLVVPQCMCSGEAGQITTVYPLDGLLSDAPDGAG